MDEALVARRAELSAERNALFARIEEALKAGDAADADRMIQELSDITQAISDLDMRALVALALAEAAQQREQGEPVRAEAALWGAIAALRKTGRAETREFAILVGNQAQLFAEAGDFVEAEDLFTKSITLLRRVSPEPGRDPELAIMLTNCAGLSTEAGQFQVATWQVNEADEILTAASKVTDAERLRELRVLQAWVSGTSGRIQESQGKIDLAEKLYRGAVTHLRELEKQDAPYYTTALHDLARLLKTSGRPYEARPYLEEALVLDRQLRGEKRLDVIEDLVALADLAVQDGRVVEAAKHMLEAAALEDQALERIGSLPKPRLMLWRDAAMPRLHRFLRLVVESPDHEPPLVEEAFRWMLRRKGIVAEALAAQGRELRDAGEGDETPLRPIHDELLEVRGKLNRELLSRDADDPSPVPVGTVAAWREREAELQMELVHRLSPESIAKELARADLGAIAAALPPESALVEWLRVEWEASEHYLAFVLNPATQPQVSLFDLGSADEIEAAAEALRAEIAKDPLRWIAGAAIRRLDEKAGALRAFVLNPLRDVLAGCTRLFLAPDGVLNRIPFEILPFGSGRLLDEMDLSYVSTGRDVLRFTTLPRPEGSPAVVVADPDFDLEVYAASSSTTQATGITRRRFRALRGARDEGIVVARLLGVEPLLGSDALKGRIKANRSPRILHIATHGFYLADAKRVDPDTGRLLLGTDSAPDGAFRKLSGHWAQDPELRAGLALAGVNRWLRGAEVPAEAEDGLLMAADIPELDLRGTDLVCLSACDTGLGDIVAGEGVMGLARAFLTAGAGAVMASLWKVPDKETRKLMARFYRELLGGTTRLEALRAAQRAVRRWRRHPFFWGAFVIEGDPGALRPL